MVQYESEIMATLEESLSNALDAARKYNEKYPSQAIQNMIDSLIETSHAVAMETLLNTANELLVAVTKYNRSQTLGGSCTSQNTERCLIQFVRELEGLDTVPLLLVPDIKIAEE